MDPGATPSALFFLVGPLMSILWGVLLICLAKKTASWSSKFSLVLTIVLALGGFDSLLGTGVINLVPFSPYSDGSKFFATLF